METFEIDENQLNKEVVIDFIRSAEDLSIVECIYSMLRRVPRRYRGRNNIGWILDLDPTMFSSLVDIEACYLDKETWEDDIKSFKIDNKEIDTKNKSTEK